MSDESTLDRKQLPLDVLDQIDRICDRFEAAWERGDRPRFEDFVGEVDPLHRQALLHDLLLAELAARRRRGEHPEAREYEHRLAGELSLVASAFGSTGRLATPADSSLLFELMAYQTGLVDEPALTEAHRLWTEHKSRPFADVLSEMGALDPSQRTLLEGLVVEHQKRHGGAEASLAALRAVRSTREFFEKLDTPEIGATLPHDASEATCEPPRPDVETAAISPGLAVDLEVTADVSSPSETDRQAGRTPLIGRRIASRYQLVRELGEGGMGTVYLAEQLKPVKRQVALKLIKPGMDTRSVLARFDSERQALALMDHPNIAKVFDAGSTEDGRPFFVMELVKGVPLTAYCDEHCLGLPERLGLFRQICSTVQHAHQKGIIHRDLKPSNILVETHDGKPVPKVIDFGLAKAVSGVQLTEHSLNSAFGTVAGTPLYMAPEQANFNAIDVDTRADIYALGVILYELLTGSTPIDRDTFKRAALDEMLRVIREVEPPMPSSRINTSEALPNIAASRQTEPSRLSRFVRGDLDWIVMKALAKERNQRYESAFGLANDLERFSNHETVSAGPPTAAYRLRKFVRRNRGRVIAGSLLLVALVGGMIGTSIGLLEASHRLVQRDRANAILLSVFENINPSGDGQTLPLSVRSGAARPRDGRSGKRGHR